MLLILNYLDMHIEIRSKMRHPESDQICCCQKHRDRLKKQTKILVSCIYKNFPPKKTLTHCYLEDSICLNLFLSITFQPRFWSPAAICRSFRSCSRIRFCSSNTCPEKAHWFTQFPSIGSLSYSKFESRDAWFMHRLAAFCCSRNSSCRSRGTAFCFRCSRALSRPPRPSWRP